MIVAYNVCDFCGNQNEIVSGSLGGISVSWNVLPILNIMFENQKYKKHQTGTFCGIICFCEFLKKKAKVE